MQVVNQPITSLKTTALFFLRQVGFISRWLSHSLSCFCPFSFTYKSSFPSVPCLIHVLDIGTPPRNRWPTLFRFVFVLGHMFSIVSADTKKGATHWFLVYPEWKMAITSIRTGSCFLFLMSLIKCHNASSGTSAYPSTVQNQPTCSYTRVISF